MPASTQWQLAEEAAERYEAILVPAILRPFAEALVDHVEIHPGAVVLDVGCGTGAAAQRAAARAGTNGQVIGIDINAGMLAVAKRRQAVQLQGIAAIEWRQGDACALPVPDAIADVALCAQTVQFLPDRARGVEEMHRALRPAGRVAVSAWCPVDQNPYFDSLVRAVERHVGGDTAKGLLAAFTLTGTDELRAVIAGAGFHNIALEAATLELELPPLFEFVPRHISATPMAAGYAAATEDARSAVVRDVVEDMSRFGSPAAPRIPFRSHLATGVKS
jgi:SAM-dependent methyltransferase